MGRYYIISSAAVVVQPTLKFANSLQASHSRMIKRRLTELVTTFSGLNGLSGCTFMCLCGADLFFLSSTNKIFHVNQKLMSYTMYHITHVYACWQINLFSINAILMKSFSKSIHVPKTKF